jgi:type I restriction enzyme S subunit
MNAERLLALYDQVAEAPDAVPCLRRFVLDLAVRGKLVPQDPADEPASELLKRIAAEKWRLVRAGAARRDSTPSTAPPDQHAFPIPSAWAWVPATFPTFGVSDPGKKVKTKDVREAGTFPVVDQGKVLIRGYIDDPEKVIKVADPIIVFGDHTREAKFIDFDFVVGADGVKLLQPISVNASYYFLALQWLPLDSRGYGRHFKLLKASALPLPPLAEQHRIVAKVEELMALLDRLEAARTAAEATRDRLTAASLARLTAPDADSADFSANARFALATLPILTTRSDQIKPLRQTILNLAVRGKLVAQDPTDELVEASITAIREKRGGMIRNKEIRREKPLAPIQDDEAPFSIPESWRWVRVGELALFTQYGTSARAAPSETGIPVLTMGNIQNGVVIRTNEKRIPEASDELPALYLKNFDLLYNRTNSAELVGKTGLYRGDDDCLTFASYLIRIRLSSEDTSPVYVNLAMNAPVFRETQIVPHIKKQTGQANVSGSTLKNMLIPLPPLAEQHRIVARVDALMALCDRLEAALATADTTRARLLDALLHEALTPSGRCRSEVAQQSSSASAASALEAVDSPAITL